MVQICKAAVKLFNIVGATLLFFPTTSLLLLHKAKILTMCCTKNVAQFGPSLILRTAHMRRLTGNISLKYIFIDSKITSLTSA